MTIALRIAGILLAVLGLLVVLMSLFSPGEPIVGLDLQLGALLFVGGVLTLGIASAVASVDELRTLLSGDEPQPLPAASVKPVQVQPQPPAGILADRMLDRSLDVGKRQDKPSQALRPLNGDHHRFNEDRPFGGHLSRSSIDRVIEEVRELGSAVTQEMESVQDVVSEEELYVVDERTIAGKQARILSDGTVEAETDEGWMRFENVDHLEEYMDAVRRQRGI